ncbi:MAG TPA: carbon monoxide dehydrogenase subunit G [candidate division Zixibacteria bacterium]|nr:carbon monoxide dehydrogenase subunit G [candidate division Zixibacteria bacterium]
MDINGTYTFDAPRDEVWKAVLDPEVLSKSLPGIEGLDSIGENEYQAKMKIRMGPVQGQFNGTVQLVDLDPPNGYHILLDASGAQGFVKGEGDLSLAELDGGTELTYSGEAQVGGRIASVGQRLIESSAQALIQQGLQAFDAQIQARMKGEEIGEDALLAEAPSEMEFAFGMTQKMLEDLVPTEKRGELLRAGVTLLAFLVIVKAVSDWWTNRLAARVAELIEQKRVA